jgi:hypothetical protein
MSQFNGDKARFNRERKQNIQRRKRARVLFQVAAAGASHSDAGKKPHGLADAGKERA